MNRMKRFKVGRVEGELSDINPHKCIVVKQGSYLSYHSLSSELESRSHEDIARILGVNDEDVLGGAHVQFPEYSGDPHAVKIYGTSRAYGSIPKAILRSFSLEELLGAYQKLDPNIQRIKYDLFGTFSNQWGHYFSTHKEAELAGACE